MTIRGLVVIIGEKSFAGLEHGENAIYVTFGLLISRNFKIRKFREKNVGPRKGWGHGYSHIFATGRSK